MHTFIDNVYIFTFFAQLSYNLRIERKRKKRKRKERKKEDVKREPPAYFVNYTNCDIKKKFIYYQ